MGHREVRGERMEDARLKRELPADAALPVPMVLKKLHETC